MGGYIMTERERLPAIQFYPGDWRKDPGVQALNYHERGVWFEMLLLMHESPKRGQLLLATGKPMADHFLAQILGIPIDNLTTLLSKFVLLGVASKNEKTGVLYNRRMVRDEKQRIMFKRYGKSGGNPNFKKGKSNPYYKPKDNHNPPNKPTHKPKITPSSSSSDVKVKGEKPKPFCSKTAVKHPPRARMSESNATALLALESQNPETTGGNGPPEPIVEFRQWVKKRIPNWVQSRAWKVWNMPEDQEALREIFRARAFFEIQALWQLFIRPGSKNYDYASNQRFSMREFRRQIEYLACDLDYSALKQRFMADALVEVASSA